MSSENRTLSYITTALLAATLVLTLVNTMILAGSYNNPVQAEFRGSEQTAQEPAAQTKSGDTKETVSEFEFPTGTPEKYGEGLGVSFDQVSSDSPKEAQKVIGIMASKDKIELTSEQKSRYVDILYNTGGGLSCEYCCEARSVIDKKGNPACGCAHAIAMRGLTKYLLTEHPDMSNSEILEEVSKWKTRFFPDQTEAKADAFQENEVEPTPVKLSVNKYSDVGSDGGDWVGDC